MYMKSFLALSTRLTFQQLKPPIITMPYKAASLEIHKMNQSVNPLSTILRDDQYRNRLHTSRDTKMLNHSGATNVNEYLECIRDLNLLQSNTQAIALAKYKVPKEFLPLFEKQLNLAGIQVEDLNRLNVIHVSGTKGKGSTCAFIERILREHGLKTGFYNSPHLIKVTERIRINGQPIDEAKFSKYFRQVYDRLQRETQRINLSMPSYFSFLTILAFHIFLEEKVDCSVIEVGIGGEYDPTNIVQKPIACGVTTLDYDHTNILGRTIESIACNKAGIAKTGVPLYTVEHEQPKVLEVIKSRCIERSSPLYICKPLQKQHDLYLGIKGSVQYANAALACQLARCFLKSKNETITNKLFDSKENLEYIETDVDKLTPDFHRALTNCCWPGRCQILRYSNKTIFLDGAHTEKSMENCLKWFLEESGKEDVGAIKILLVNVIGERNKQNVLKPLTSFAFDHVIFSSNKINSLGDTPKSQTFVNIQSNSEKSIENTKRNVEAWKSIVKEANKTEVEVTIKSNTSDSIEFIERLITMNPEKNFHILVTGSLHFVGAILETLSVVNV